MTPTHAILPVAAAGVACAVACAADPQDGPWPRERVSVGRSDAALPALVAPPAGPLHAFWTGGRETLSLATRAETGWTAPAEAVPAGSPLLGMTLEWPSSSVAGATDGTVHVLWGRGFTAMPPGGTWTEPEDLGVPGAETWGTMLAPDHSGGVHALLQVRDRGGTEELWHRHRPGGGPWSAPSLAWRGSMGRVTGASSDRTGNLLVTLRSERGADVIRLDANGNWSLLAPLSPLGAVGTGVHMDAGGAEHALVLDDVARTLAYVHRPAGGGWGVPVVLSSTEPPPGRDRVIGRDPDITVDALGGVHVLFQDGSFSAPREKADEFGTYDVRLRYAYGRPAGPFVEVGPVWRKTENNTSVFTSRLVTDQAGCAHLLWTREGEVIHSWFCPPGGAAGDPSVGAPADADGP